MSVVPVFVLTAVTGVNRGSLCGAGRGYRGEGESSR